MIPFKDKQAIQDFLAHPGWELFKVLLLDGKENRPSLHRRLLADLISAGRSGDAVKAARAVGGLDLINTVLEEPEKFLKS
jgi:hypothetical protein